ncbi:hypothetical protein FOA52_016137 [Chlamydomonas sp. UWO 241]|nr:hypothetical protein FOA52_016137 [Chlamydomonas sp. UWO 241]
MEEMLRRFGEGKTYADIPVECSADFVRRFNQLMDDDILNKNDPHRPGMFGRVRGFMVRYEVQARGSLHIHMVLWLDEVDTAEVAKEIVATMPADWDAAAEAWVEPPPTDERRHLLFKLVERKQMRNCSEVEKVGGCRERDKCRYGFPYAPHTNQVPLTDETNRKILYYRLRYEDRNISEQRRVTQRGVEFGRRRHYSHTPQRTPWEASDPGFQNVHGL